MMFAGLLRRAEPADGSVPGLEAIATGITPAFLDAAAERAAFVGRRDRAAVAGTDVTAEALAKKLLHAWLQNRHQTLVPLTLNMRLLTEEQRDIVAQALAAFLLAGRPHQDALAAVGSLGANMAGLGADAATLAALDRAVQDPLPLNLIIERAQEFDLSVYLYVAALMASDQRFPASALFCDLVQARFDLPSAVVRSAARRYRR